MGEDVQPKAPDPNGVDEEMFGESARESGIVTVGNTMSGDQIKLSRVRKYGDKAQGPFIVYLRAKERHSLNVPKVAADLFQRYPSIDTVDPVNRDKLKIILKNKGEANLLAANKELGEKFFVYIPAKDAEVSGKILLNDCAEVYQIMGAGYGMLNGQSEKIKIIEVSRLAKKIEDNGAAKTERTPFVRVIFEGTVLPDYLILNKLRIPVKPYAPRVMQCKVCFRLGHSESHCGNRKRCEKCGLIHEEGKSSLSCREGAYSCPNCRMMYREKDHLCPRIDEIKDRAVEKVLAKREEARVPGLNLNKAPPFKRIRDAKENENAKVKFDQNFPPLTTRNRYNVLFPGDEDILSISSVQDCEPKEGNYSGRVLKRKNSGNLQPENDNVWFKWAEEHDKAQSRKNPRTNSPTNTPITKQKISAHQKTAQDTNCSPSGFDWKQVVIWVLEKLGLSKELVGMVVEVVFPLAEKLWPKLFSSMLNHHGQ